MADDLTIAKSTTLHTVDSPNLREINTFLNPVAYSANGDQPVMHLPKRQYLTLR